MQRFLPAIVLLLASCKEVTVSSTHPGFKDSIVKEYLARTDSLDFPDTINYDFKILKAYFKDDTSFFTQLQKEIEFERKYATEGNYFDSCFQLKKLSDLNVDEAYRFHHSQSFCFYNQIVTITRNSGSVSLHYMETSGSPEGKVLKLQTKGGEKTIGPGCRLEKEFLKTLTVNDWEVLEGYVEDADYWGLKSRSSRSGFDGSSWTIEAYSKNPKYLTDQQIHRVYRWSPENSFKQLGRIFMKLAEEKGMCGEEIN
jgi:hypothetical protein